MVSLCEQILCEAESRFIFAKCDRGPLMGDVTPFDFQPSPERRLLEQIAMRVVDVPSLFTIVPTERGSLDPRSLWSKPVKITLWCTDPGHEHPVSSASYEISLPKEWFRQVLPYLRTTLKLLKLLAIVKGVATHFKATEVAAQVEILEGVCNSAELAVENQANDIAGANESALETSKPRDEGPADRAVKRLLLTLGETNSFAPLRKLVDRRGEILWVCPEHYNSARSSPPINQELPSLICAPREATPQLARQTSDIRADNWQVPKKITLKIDGSSFIDIMTEVQLSGPPEAFYVCADFPEKRRRYILFGRNYKRPPYIGYGLAAAPGEPILFRDTGGRIRLLVEYIDSELRLWDVSQSHVWSEKFWDIKGNLKSGTSQTASHISSRRSESRPLPIEVSQARYVDLSNLVSIEEGDAFAFDNRPVAEKEYAVLISGRTSSGPCVGDVLALGVGDVILLRDCSGRMIRVVGARSNIRVIDAAGYMGFFGMLKEAHVDAERSDQCKNSFT